jgi:hypothetical protein
MADALPPGVSATLHALLIGPDPVSSALRAQITHARVADRCGCGCATVDLSVDRTAAPPAPPASTQSSGLAADAWYAVPADAGVLVFTEDGYLSRLEIYAAADDPPTTWPEPHFAERSDTAPAGG